MLERLNHLLTLKDGWDSYGAKAPNKIAVDNAYLFCTIALNLGLNVEEIKPSVIGGVTISYNDDKSGRMTVIEFYNTGNVFTMFSETKIKLEQVPAHEEAFTNLVEEIKIYIGRDAPNEETV